MLAGAPWAETLRLRLFAVGLTGALECELLTRLARPMFAGLEELEVYLKGRRATLVQAVDELGAHAARMSALRTLTLSLSLSAYLAGELVPTDCADWSLPQLGALTVSGLANVPLPRIYAPGLHAFSGSFAHLDAAASAAIHLGAPQLRRLWLARHGQAEDVHDDCGPAELAAVDKLAELAASPLQQLHLGFPLPARLLARLPIVRQAAACTLIHASPTFLNEPPPPDELYQLCRALPRLEHLTLSGRAEWRLPGADGPDDPWAQAPGPLSRQRPSPGPAEALETLRLFAATDASFGPLVFGRLRLLELRGADVHLRDTRALLRRLPALERLECVGNCRFDCAPRGSSSIKDDNKEGPARGAVALSWVAYPAGPEVAALCGALGPRLRLLSATGRRYDRLLRQLGQTPGLDRLEVVCLTTALVADQALAVEDVQPLLNPRLFPRLATLHLPPAALPETTARRTLVPHLADHIVTLGSVVLMRH